MTAGRCPGCGFEDPSCKLVRNHMTACGVVAALYRSDPSKVLEPEMEYERYRAEDATPEVKAAARDEWLQTRYAEIDTRRDAQRARWNQPDILAEGVPTEEQQNV